MCWCAIKKLLTHPTRSIVCLYRIDDGIDVAAKQKAEQKLSDGEKSLRGGGLVPSDSWADNTPVKKVQRTDSQKKEKRQRTLSLKTNKKMAAAQGQVQELYIMCFWISKNAFLVVFSTDVKMLLTNV